MTPHKGSKNLVQDQSAKESNPNFDIYLDTTTCLTSSIKSRTQVYEILEEEKSILSYDGSEGEDVIQANKLKDFPTQT